MGEVALRLLGKPNPGAKQDDWRYGKNDKLSINPMRGVWNDFSTGESGGVLALIKREKGRADGRAWLREEGLLDQAGRAKNSKATPKGNGAGGGNGHDDKDAEAERKLAEARRIAGETKPIRGTLAAAYLKSRAIDISAGRLLDEDLRDVRFHPGDPSRNLMPMLVGVLRDPATGIVPGSIHRTRLNVDGTRARRRKDGRPLKKMGLGRYGEGMICVGDMSEDGPLFISEGIEDLLSATNLTGTKGQATLGYDRLRKMRLKRGTPLLLLAQKKNDVDRSKWEKVGQHFAAQGCEVDMVWPGKYGDINELLVAEGPDAVRAVIEASEPVTPASVEQTTAADDDASDQGGADGETASAATTVGNYRVSLRGMEYYARPPNSTIGNWVWITNFTAAIKSQIRLDDGVEATLTFEIEAAVNGRTSTFFVPSAQFGNMNWVIENLGAEAIVYPNQEKRTRVGIQALSGSICRRSVYTHTGFRKIGDEYVYMHAGGALGAEGPLEGLEVQMPAGLENYLLEREGTKIGDKELCEAVEASMGCLSVAPLRATILLHASMPRAVIGGADYTPYIVGKTGARKTEMMALEAQHFGAAMHSRALPGAWTSTDNYLESAASAAKDAIFPIDDYVVPTSSGGDAARLAAKADRVLRAQGNASGRGRLSSDTKQRRTRPPRGMIMSTGEDVPPGHSLRARLLVIVLGLGDVDLDKLTIAQQHANKGDFARVTAGFIRWLAPQYEAVRRELKEFTHQYRVMFPEGVHGRTADIFGQVMATWRLYMRFVVATGAWTQAESDAHLKTVWETLNELIIEQSDHQRAFDAVVRFQTNLDSSLASGKAHIGRQHHPDRPPPGALSVGWKRIEVPGGEGTTEHRWQPSGPCIGWYADDGLYLNGEAAYAAAQQAAVATGNGIGVGPDTLYRRMRDDNLLLSLEKRAGKTYLKVRKTIAGIRRPVIHVSHEFLHLPPPKPPSSTEGVPSSPNNPDVDFSEEYQDASE
jgi:hypothetical protein